MRVPGLFTHLQYHMEDKRFRNNPTLEMWDKNMSGNDASLYLFGQDGHLMLGLDGKLWRFREYPVTSIAYRMFKPLAEWFSRLERPMTRIWVRDDIPWRWKHKHECRFECFVLDGDRPESKIVWKAPLENVNHALIRLQRWIRRVVVRRGQIRLALLMGLHARLGQNCALGALGHDLILGLLVKGASAAQQ